MKRRNIKGFTIIETMLFLAISGLLVTLILAGTGSSISRQRYRDSLTSLQATLQEQYSKVANVNNDRNNDWICDSSSGAVTQVATGSGVNRGQSNCVILGKYITPSANGKSLTIKTVVGSVPSTAGLINSDIIALNKYGMRVSPTMVETYNLPWDVVMQRSGSTTVSSFSMLILNSPLSGDVRTFIDNTTIVGDLLIKNLITQANLSNSLTVCLSYNGMLTSNRSSVVVNAGASSSNDIETFGDNSGC